MVRDDEFDEVKRIVPLCVKQIEAYLIYEGTNQRERHNKAKVSVGHIGSYSRLRGTRANERQLAILESRFASGGVTPESQAALAGPSTQALPAKK